MIERDLYHGPRRGCVEGKTQRPAHHRRAPDYCRDRLSLNELIRSVGIPRLLLPLTRRFSEVIIALVCRNGFSRFKLCDKPLKRFRDHWSRLISR